MGKYYRKDKDSIEEIVVAQLTSSLRVPLYVIRTRKVTLDEM